MSGAGTGPPSSSSHPSLSRIQQVLDNNINRSQGPQQSRVGPDPPSSPYARRQSFAGLSASRPQSGPRGLHGVLSSSTSSSSSSSPMPMPMLPPRSVSTFQPHVVRGTIDRPSSDQPVRQQPPPLTRPQHSPTRTRRPSNSLFVASPSSPRPASRLPVPNPSAAAAIASASSFPQPAYLKESALRHLIQSEPPRAPLPNRTRFDAPGQPQPHYAASSSTPSPIAWRDASPGRNSETDDDETVAQLPPLPPPPAAALPPEQMMPLPSCWSQIDRCINLTVSVDGRDLTFQGPTGTVDEAAAARANHPIPPACGIYYYEVEILHRGRQGHISIGFSEKNVKLTRLPGWEGHSWGYHGDDGRTFADQRTGTQYGPTFTSGDRVGCGIDFSQGRAFFTKNGRFIDYVFTGLEGGPGCELYPSVGLRSTDESIRANFGQEPFQFDIVSHVQQQRNTRWTQIQTTPFRWSTRADGTFGVESSPEGVAAHATATAESDEAENRTAHVNELILGYLSHHGYASAARAFKAQCQAKTTASTTTTTAVAPVGDDSPDVEMAQVDEPVETDTDTQARQRIYHAVLRGNIDAALAETRTYYPAVLSREGGLMLFKLRCRKYGELIIEAAEARSRRQRHMDEVAQGVLLEAEEDSMDVDDDAKTHTNGYTNTDTNTNDDAMENGATTGAAVDPALLKGKMKAAAYSVGVGGDGGPEEQRAITYGQALRADYAGDTRPQVIELFKRTSVLWAFESPREQGGTMTEYASQSARAELANELNQTILESQGRPTQPALERLYRHTEACIMTLGAIGVGAAAFADVRKEFLDSDN